MVCKLEKRSKKKCQRKQDTQVTFVQKNSVLCCLELKCFQGYFLFCYYCLYICVFVERKFFWLLYYIFVILHATDMQLCYEHKFV